MEKLETLAARLEMEQARRDYKESWSARPYSVDIEESTWAYVGSAYNAWAAVWDESDWWCDLHYCSHFDCAELLH